MSPDKLASGETEAVEYFYDYHIVFSTVFSVPVLYFQAQDKDGRILTHEEHWGMVPAHHRNPNTQRIFFSYAEHPALGRPFFFIHPCETANVMSLFQIPREDQSPASEKQQGIRYLTSWLGVYGGVVGVGLTSEQASALLAEE